MSEQKAEALYGKAPEADEAAHTSQAVPDPGNADSYRAWGGLQAGALDSTHLGLWVRITDTNGSQCAGQLLRVEHGANIIEERTLTTREPTLTLGNRWVHVTFGAFSGHRVNPHARVEVQRG
jgi:hypothetical protein